MIRAEARSSSRHRGKLRVIPRVGVIDGGLIGSAALIAVMKRHDVDDSLSDHNSSETALFSCNCVKLLAKRPLSDPLGSCKKDRRRVGKQS